MRRQWPQDAVARGEFGQGVYMRGQGVTGAWRARQDSREEVADSLLIECPAPRTPVGGLSARSRRACDSPSQLTAPSAASLGRLSIVSRMLVCPYRPVQLFSTHVSRLDALL